MRPSDSLIERLNRLDEADFVAEIGPLYEHSPWIAVAVWRERPFPDRMALQKSLTRIIRSSTDDQKLALILAHPDLAGRFTGPGDLTAHSAAEQRQLGLDRLNEAEAERFNTLNRAYRERFHMPFIVAVRNQARSQVIEAFEQRLQHAKDLEIETAIEEIGKIAGFRLDDLR